MTEQEFADQLRELDTKIRNLRIAYDARHKELCAQFHALAKDAAKYGVRVTDGISDFEPFRVYKIVEL